MTDWRNDKPAPKTSRRNFVSIAGGVLAAAAFGLAPACKDRSDDDENETRPTSTSTPTPQLLPSVAASATTIPPTPTPAKPIAGQVLYRANWTTGMEGWSGDPGWQALNGEMLHDGSNNNVLTPLLAPIILSTSDYAVEADVVPGRWEECFCNRGIFLVARYDKSKGVYYFGQMDSAREMGIFENSGGPPNDISSIPSSVKAGSLLTLRAEVKGNSLKLIVDGRLLIDTTDNRVLTAGRVGIACSENQGTVRRFEVSAL